MTQTLEEAEAKILSLEIEIDELQMKVIVVDELREDRKMLHRMIDRDHDLIEMLFKYITDKN